MTYAKNGSPQPQPQTSKQTEWSEQDSAGLTKLWRLRVGETLLLLALFGLIAFLSAGCAQTSTPPSAWPLNPQPPQIGLEPPTESYTSRVQSFLRKSRERLTSIQAM